MAGRNLVVCLDGTWLDAASSTAPHTNPHALQLSTNLGNQVNVYLPGVGTGNATIDRLWFGLTGKGVFRSARQAWKALLMNHQPGDRIFIFGFSRGAFAARCLASMLVRIGLHGFNGEIEGGFRRWLATIGMRSEGTQEEVHFLGLFDCVPGNRLYMWRDGNRALLLPDLERGIRHFRHAVARDEVRWTFRPLLFKRSDQLTFAQCWFPGYHSDVGGGAGAAHGLACFAQWWMLREAFGQGLEFKNVECPRHLYGHALSVVSGVDPDEPGRCPSDVVGRLLPRMCRAEYLKDPEPEPTLKFQDMDICPRCGEEMFDYFDTIPGRRWAEGTCAKAGSRVPGHWGL